MARRGLGCSLLRGPRNRTEGWCLMLQFLFYLFLGVYYYSTVGLATALVYAAWNRKRLSEREAFWMLVMWPITWLVGVQMLLAGIFGLGRKLESPINDLGP